MTSSSDLALAGLAGVLHEAPVNKTAHQLAYLLLAGPDLPVFIAGTEFGEETLEPSGSAVVEAEEENGDSYVVIR